MYIYVYMFIYTGTYIYLNVCTCTCTPASAASVSEGVLSCLEQYTGQFPIHCSDRKKGNHRSREVKEKKKRSMHSA